MAIVEEEIMNNCSSHAFTSLQNSIDTNALLTKLASIEAAIPYNEAQVQLALAGAQASITSDINAANIANLTGQCSIVGKIADQTQFIAQNFANASAQAERNANLITTAVHAEGGSIRALINDNQIADLNRIAAEREARIVALETRSYADGKNHGIEINMVQNQNATQLAMQAQVSLMERLADKVCYVESAQRATQQAINIGNTGGGPIRQDSTNTNVKA